MKSFVCVKKLGISILIILTAFVTLSCSGLFLPKNAKSEMGTITIALPGNGARRGYTQDDADFFKVSIISESTKEVVIPAQETNAETFSADLKAGSYSVIVQGMNNSNVSQPLFYGRTNKVTVTAGETTAATILMRELGFDSSLYSGHMEMVNPDWESGKLPSLAFDYFDFEGWYSDAECTQAITEYPATDSEDFSYPFAKLVRKPVFYATQYGDGNKKGLNADNPMELAEAFTELARFSRETGKVPTLVLLGDVYLDGSSVAWSVNIIGAQNGVDNDPVTVSGALNGCVVPFNAGTSCTVKNLIIVNGNAATGIKNAGNLTFENCVFNPDSKDLAIENTGSLTLTNCQISSTTGAQGIKNAGSLKMTDCSISGCGTNTTLGGGIYTTQPITLINTSITDCNGSYGKMIYCAKEEGGNPTVNGIGAEFEGDFYFDGSISAATKYGASTFPVGPTQSGVYYVRNTATGNSDGSSPDNAMAIGTALDNAGPVAGFATTGKIPTIYLLEDEIELPNDKIRFDVNIIGRKDNVEGAKVTIKVATGYITADSASSYFYFDTTTNTLKNIKITHESRNGQERCVRTKGDLTVENCEFTSGKQGNFNGGAILHDSNTGTLTVIGSIFTSCSALYGGGIFSNGDTIIKNTQFIQCSSGNGGGGGAIRCEGKLEVSGSSFTGCNGTSNGGAIAYIGTSLTVSDSTFTGCYATPTDTTYGNGGAIQAKNEITLSNITISGCTANRGNSIYVNSPEGKSTVNGKSFAANSWCDDSIDPNTDWDNLTWSN